MSSAAGAERAGKVVPKRSVGCGATSAVAPGEEKVTTTSSGAERWYYRHVPPQQDGDHPLPVVLDFHGYTEGATVHVQHSKLGPFGDTKGFVTITPHGQGPVPRWDTSFDSVDTQFINDLLDELARTLCIDERRIYATGLSNGAFMSSALACTLADRIAAVAPVAGVRALEDCQPARPIPVVAFHGTDDQYVSYRGGVGPAARNLPNPDGSARTPNTTTGTAPALLRPSIPDTVADWAERNGCGSKASEREVAFDVTVISYRCPDHADVRLYRVRGGGHTWPGSEFSKAIESVTGHTTFSIDANEVMWKFFRRHPLRPD